MKKHAHVDKINKATMSKAAKHYSCHKELTEPENVALQMTEDAANKPILDIGVGAGRTTAVLTELSSDYIGIDYVEEMVRHCKQQFPHIHFECADARDLSRFTDGQFYLIVFSMNGLSMVDHVGRMRILNEVSRLLKPDGVFLFSAYNKANRRHLKIFHFPEFHFTFHPLKLIKRKLQFTYTTLLRARNRYRHRKHEVHTDDYSMVNDVCHDYSTMLYYTSRSNQIDQLRSVGFAGAITTLDLAGKQIEGETGHDSIFYIARKQ